MKKHNEDHTQENAFTGEYERLCAYVLGELEGAEAQAIEESLASDAALRAERDRLEATIGLVTKTCGDAESLSPAIMETLERAAQPVQQKVRWTSRTPLRIAAGFAAIATGVLGGRALMQAPGAVEKSDLASLEHGARNKDSSEEPRKAERPDSSLLKYPEYDDRKRLAGRTIVTSESEAGAASTGGTYRGPGDNVPPQQLEERAKSLQSQADASLFALELNGEPKGATVRTIVTGPDASQRLTLGVMNNASRGEFKDVNAVVGGVGGGGQAPPAERYFDAARVPEVALGIQTDPDPNNSWRLVSNSKSGSSLLSPPGGGGVSTPGPSGPSSPGPSGPSAPGASGPATVGRVATTVAPQAPPQARYHAGTGQWSRTFADELPPANESMRARRELYFGADAEQPETGSDDFFLGHGQKDKKRTRKSAQELYEDRTRFIFNDCIRLPNERPRDMFFRFWGDNAFELTRLDAQSTFGVDVDTASYTLARRYLNGGNLPTKAQIRTEEFLNYFKPDLPAPTEDVFGIHTELAPSRFGNDAAAPSQRWLLRVGVRGQEIAREERKALNLTFIVDTSGSMKEGNRLELVKHALRLLVGQLDAGDSIAIVGFSKSASLVLPMTSAQNRGVIEAALHGLTADGGTNAEAGLKFGYEVAAAALTSEAHNRVVFLSDGVANIGQTHQDRLNESIRKRRESGIYLNTIGVGMSNHNDTFLEQLANKGDGLCNYVDSADEARRALVDNFTGAFQPIARDVKLQVEFDPSQVYRYRLLGYENRAIADADFRNDAVDAGEVGAGHQVVALYELELTGSPTDVPLAQVNLRWKAPTGAGRDPLEDAATERTHAVGMGAATNWEGASLGYRRSAVVAQFAEILRRSIHARGDSLDALIAEAQLLSPLLQDEDFNEFVELLQRSHELIRYHAPRENDLANCIDSLRRNRILRAQLEDLRRTENQEVLGQLERNNAELEAKIRDLIRGEIEKETQGQPR